jgi:hypothetical protein
MLHFIEQRRRLLLNSLLDGGEQRACACFWSELHPSDARRARMHALSFAREYHAHSKTRDLESSLKAPSALAFA